MTVCIGVKHKGQVFVSADSIAIADDGEFDLHGESKVWTDGPWVIASCGSHRAAQVIRTQCPLPRRVPRDPLKYLIEHYTQSIRGAFHRFGYVADTKLSDCPMDGQLIVAVRGHLFEIAGDLAVSETTRDYSAIGAGAPWAAGALHATQGQPVRTRVAKAMAAAEANSAKVRGPFTMEIAA